MRLIIFLFFTLFLSSCSYFYGDKGIIHNRETDYLSARSYPPLAIPPGLSSSTMTTHYPIPEHCYPESSKRIGLIPPELYRPRCITPPPPPRKPVMLEVPMANAQPVAPAAASVVTQQPTKVAMVQPAANPIMNSHKNAMPNYYFDSHTRSTWTAGKIITPPWESTAPKQQTAVPQTPAQIAETRAKTQEYMKKHYYFDPYTR